MASINGIERGRVQADSKASQMPRAGMRTPKNTTTITIVEIRTAATIWVISPTLA